jgi:PAB-dependent poly(A)-specific ribonuclease subunit 2
MHLNQHDRFFLGGFSDFIYDFDIERLRVLRQLSVGDEQSDCILMKCSSTQNPSTRNGILCTGSSNGQIILRDPFTLKYLHKFHPHSGSLSDFDVHGNQLVTCGFSLTRNGTLGVDRFLMVYDLRMMRSLSPVQLIIEPCFLHFLPMCSSVVAVGSQVGSNSILLQYIELRK